MAQALKINSSRYTAALHAFLAHSRREIGASMVAASRDLVSEVLKVTPPNQNGRWNQAAGRKAVRADILKVLAGSVKGSADPDSSHTRFRRNRGRVNTNLKRGKRDGRIRIQRQVLKNYIAKRQANVGTLAAGWNAAAFRLGVRVPGWIARHGTKKGSFELEVSASRVRVRIVNAISFSNQVSGLVRRTQWAMEIQAQKLERRVKNYAVKAAARKAGFKAQ